MYISESKNQIHKIMTLNRNILSPVKNKLTKQIDQSKIVTNQSQCH